MPSAMSVRMFLFEGMIGANVGGVSAERCWLKTWVWLALTETP